jgi:ABC-type glucose/galactose transport system permease subunit
MALNSVGSAYNKDRIIKNLQGSFSFRGKINVTGGIKQGYFRIGNIHYRLCGKDRYSPVTLYFIRIKKGVAVVNSSEPADLSGSI